MPSTDKAAQVRRWDNLSAQPIDTSIIDPLDTRGQKNRYISELRNATIIDALDRHGASDPVLDFGCGTGGLSAAASQSGRSVVGIDISAGLLSRTAERRYPNPALFVRYDGERLPLQDALFAAATTYVVLTHIIDNDDLLGVLREIHRVLRPGGVLVAGEQVRRRSSVNRTEWKNHRTIEEFNDLCRRAGFMPEEASVIRHSRFPTTYALRYGWLPVSLHAWLRQLERRVGSWLGVFGGGYSDVCFVARKPAAP